MNCMDFLTNFLFLQVCPYYYYAHGEFQKHEGMDPQEPVHAGEDQQFCSGKSICNTGRFISELEWIRLNQRVSHMVISCGNVAADSARQWASKGLAGEEEQS